jgi:GNAT superfamily N-acetyltransferase
MEERDVGTVSALLGRCYRWSTDVEGYTSAQVEFLVEERGSEETLRRESGEQRYLVACANGEIRVMVAVDGNEVAKLYVDPDRHGQGIGAALMRAAESVIRDTGFERLTLGTTPGTVPFYEACGLRIAGRRLHEKGVFAGRTTILMEKALQAEP